LKEFSSMKRMIKQGLKPFWKLTSPIRTPISNRLDARMQARIDQAVRTHMLPMVQASLDGTASTLARLETSIENANRSAGLLVTDIDLMLSSVVREMARLQMQVDAMQELLEDAVGLRRSGLSLHETDDSEVQAKVG
jgi:hypothetical protein